MIVEQQRTSKWRSRALRYVPPFLLITLLLVSVLFVANVSSTESTTTALPISPVHIFASTQSVAMPAPSLEPLPAPVSTQRERVRWGAYVGWQEANMAEFEAIVGGVADLRAVFIHWGNEKEFPMELAPTIKGEGKTLIIFWEATDYNNASTEQPRFSYDAVVRGDWDDYFKSFAASIKLYDAPVILVPFSEMNGDWFTVSGTKNGNSPTKHIRAYRHIRNIFRDVPNVQFGWAPNNVSVPDIPGNQIADYYPGDAYVDIVGVDGFNFGGTHWESFSQLFDAPLAQLRTYNKPVYIFSFASAEGARKSAWIKDALTVQIPKHPEIKGWVWFNEKKEANWLVSSDGESLEAFRASIW